MYPSEELRFLAASKEALREQIFVRREICAVAAARVARPIAWLDRVQARWHNLSPLVKMAALPAGLLSCALLMICLSALTSVTSPEQFWRWVERVRE